MDAVAARAGMSVGRARRLGREITKPLLGSAGNRERSRERSWSRTSYCTVQEQPHCGLHQANGRLLAGAAVGRRGIAGALGTNANALRGAANRSGRNSAGSFQLRGPRLVP